MNLILGKYEIKEPIENIIMTLKNEANWDVFHTIINKGNYLSVTCPFHKNGTESHPSCSIYIDTMSNEVAPGTFHCFTCGEKGQLPYLVAHVLKMSILDATQWLTDRFGVELYSSENIEFEVLQEPEHIYDIPTNAQVLDESILDQYMFYHPYAQYRKISFDIGKRFKIGWNETRNTITFPVWNEYNDLVMITERSIDSKKFYIPTGIEKPVYLLNFVQEDKSKTVIVCEGQIDALVAWSYGFPAVALFGAGTTDYQLDILKKSGIMRYILMYDNDIAGRKGAQKFKQSMGSQSLITDIIMPVGRDIADLSKEEFNSLLSSYNIDLTSH